MMKIIRQKSCENIFPYIAYIPENVSNHPALLIQLHGAGERGNGGDELEKVLVHGFSKIVNDNNFNDCILICKCTIISYLCILYNVNFTSVQPPGAY